LVDVAWNTSTSHWIPMVMMNSVENCDDGGDGDDDD